MSWAEEWITVLVKDTNDSASRIAGLKATVDRLIDRIEDLERWVDSLDDKVRDLERE